MLRSQAWRAAAAAALLGTGAHAAESVTGRVGNGHGARGYELRVPSGHDARQPLPLLVALHGCLQTPAQLAGVARLDRLADEKRILVLYPEQSVAANPARCWNWFNPSDQQRGSGEPALIASMIDEVRSKHAVDAARIYVAGISAGGMLSGTLLACYPDVFAAGAIVAGGMYRAANGLAEGMSVMRSGSAYDPQVRGEEAWKCGGSLAPRPVPVLVVHGDADSVVAPVNADQAVAQFLRTNDFADDGSANGSVGGKLADGTRERAPGGLEYTCRDARAGDAALVRYCAVHGLGHAWAGGDAAYPYAEPKGPDATAMMWSFFEQHARRRAR